MPSPEEKIKELRTLEAAKNDYMGQSGKFGVILKAYGEPIIAEESGGWWSETRIDLDPYEIEEEGIKTCAEDEEGTLVGLFFDGGRIGTPIEIKLIDGILKVSYNGKPVYVEEAGDLLSYVPGPWEKIIGRLYPKAESKVQEMRKIEKERERIKAEKEKKAWLQQLRDTWGI